MRPPGRASAAILVLDRILAGEPAEKALTAWGRGSRYAGSKDRAAVRDIVYDALRQRRTAHAFGGGGNETGRALVLGILRARGETIAEWFDGSDHAPAPVAPDEAAQTPEGAAASDIPDWLEPPLRAALGDDFAPVLQAMRQRAPVILRVNRARISLADAIRALAREGIDTRPHITVASALEVVQGAKAISASQAYNAGLIELQDASSQAVVLDLPLADGMRVLDLCAGGGGKTLAMGACAELSLLAYDASPRRMADLKTRAARAGLEVQLTDTPEAQAPYDLVLTDVPCSGSGSWRRDPEGKWQLTRARLQELVEIQAAIMDRAAGMIRPGGWLAYATCSFLREENEDQLAAFLTRHPGWTLAGSRRFGPLDTGDGFFSARLRRS